MTLLLHSIWNACEANVGSASGSPALVSASKANSPAASTHMPSGSCVTAQNFSQRIPYLSVTESILLHLRAPILEQFAGN
tara:strand:+ start:922 stop:1161 length:240 start_codon:yes stop_codon:yes gene_type:complete